MADFFTAHIYVVAYSILAAALFGAPALLGCFAFAAGLGRRAYWTIAGISFVVILVGMLGAMVWGLYTMPLNVH